MMKAAAVVMVLLFGVVILAGLTRDPNHPSVARESQSTPARVPTEAELLERARKEARQQLDMHLLRWTASYSVMVADFSFKNTSDFDIKDIVVSCVHTAPSGTQIDSSERTIYDIIPAHGDKVVSRFNMGFIHSQAAKTSCEVKNVVVSTYRPGPAKKEVAASPKK